VVEHQLPKLRVAGSTPVSRSTDQKKDGPYARLFVFEPPKGVEPSTCSLRVSCSTTELRRLISDRKYI
jgi:hypothetical protein